MTNGGRPWFLPRLDGLAVRVAAFLTLALLPVGLIALYQTREFQQETQERAGLTLLALTAQGRALDAAAIGEVVQVMNLASRQVVEAEAIGPGRVRVRHGAAPLQFAGRR